MHNEAILVEILVLIAVAVGAATLFTRLGLGAILGYLVGGVLIGPMGLGVIENADRIAYIGEFGVAFLLFLIGIELKPSRLWVMRRLVFGLGTAQLLGTGLILSLLIAFFLDMPSSSAMLVGFGLALSSTAFGVQFLASKNQLSTHWGRAVFSILLLQDLAVVPMLAMVPIIASGKVAVGASFGLALVETLAILAAVIFVGRYAITPLFRLVAAIKTPEVFTGFALLLVLGAGWLMNSIGLSMAMGAFLAGLLMAESEFRHQVEADIMPFRGMLLGLFFMSVGMGINFTTLADQTGLIALCLLILVSIKAVIIVLLSRGMGLNWPDGIKAGALLAQSGEFGFVVFSFALEEGVLAASLVDALAAVIALSMALTPLLFLFGSWLSRQTGEKQAQMIAIPDENEGPRKQVLIAGFGRVGQTVARFLTDLEIPFTAVDLDPANIQRAQGFGYKAVYGDASRPEILKALGAQNAALLVITVDDTKAAERILLTIKRDFKALPTYVRTHNSRAAQELKKIGATHTVPETVEASISLAAQVARSFSVGEDNIREIIVALRENDYATLIAEDAGT